VVDIYDGGGAFSTYESASLGYTPSTRKVGEVMAQVKRTFGDESGVQLEDADLIRWINDAQDVIVNRNKVLKARAQTSSLVGVGTYTFPSENILEIDSLHFDGEPLQNVPFAQAEREYIGKDLSDDVAVPLAWWEWAGTFTLWPAPSTSSDIVLYYTVRPTTVVSSGELLGLPDKYYPQILQYVLQQAYEMDEDYQASQMKGKQFEDALNEYGEQERSAQHMTFQSVTLVDGYDW
jgi:hypothetical protein